MPCFRRTWLLQVARASIFTSRIDLFRYGFKCRFLGAHIQKNESGSLSLTSDVDLQAQAAVAMAEMNFILPETQKLLRSKKVVSDFVVFISMNHRLVPIPHH